MDNRPTLTKTKIKTSTKVGLALGAGIIAVAAIAIVIQRPPGVFIIRAKPDLFGTSTLAPTWQTDGKLSFKIVVKNQGKATAGASTVKIYTQMGDNIPQASMTNAGLVKEAVIEPLEPGSVSKEVEVFVDVPPNFKLVNMITEVDSKNQVVESDEGNNKSWAAVPPRPFPDLFGTSTLAPTWQTDGK
ncbi:MAG: CARDB domain-containing protein, partial [Patescibacteria group bacterium]